MKISDAALYLCDNGACYCGRHLGATARATGYDISGQQIERVTPSAASEALSMGWAVSCEVCGVAK